MLDYSLKLMALWAIFGAAASVVAYLADQARLIHVGAAAIMGVGSYTAALLATKLGWSPWLALSATIPAGMLLGLVIHLATSRLSDDYLALATLAIAVILYGLMQNLEAITNGAMGVSAIPQLTPVLGHQAADILALLIMTSVLISRIRKTGFGRRVRATRDDQELADNLELRAARVRAALFVGSSAILAVVGGFYAFVIRFIDTSSFTLRESITILAMALVFKVPLPIRGAAGALFFIALPEILRFFGVEPTIGAQLRQLVFAIALIVIAARAPEMVGQQALVRGKAHA